MSKNRTLSFKYFFYDFVRVTAIPGLLFFRPKKIYISEEAKKKIRGGALIISNHVSLSDPMYLMLTIWYRRHHFIAMKELFEKSKFNEWLFSKAFLCIKIDRDNFSIKTFKEIVNHLKNDEVVTMFPEGRVNINKEGTNAFKSGMIIMALKSGCPIVPVYIKRRKHWYSRLILGVGEPLDIKNFSKGDKPTMEEINEAAKYLELQESKLEALCLGDKKDGQ